MMVGVNKIIGAGVLLAAAAYAGHWFTMQGFNLAQDAQRSAAFPQDHLSLEADSPDGQHEARTAQASDPSLMTKSLQKTEGEARDRDAAPYRAPYKAPRTVIHATTIHRKDVVVQPPRHQVANDQEGRDQTSKSAEVDDLVNDSEQAESLQEQESNVSELDQLARRYQQGSNNAVVPLSVANQQHSVPSVARSDLLAAIKAMKTLRAEDQILLDTVGYKNTLVVFGASWCGPCRQQIPEIIKLSQAHSKKLDVVIVGVDEDLKDWQMFLKGMDGVYEKTIVISDSKSQLPELFNINAMPSSFVFSDAGSVEFELKGYKFGEEQRIVDVINRLPNPAPLPQKNKLASH